MKSPFCRADLFDTTRDVPTGEFTRTPGGAQECAVRHDTDVGTIWPSAQLKRALDVWHGRPHGRLYGTAPIPELNPAGHMSRADQPGPCAPLETPYSQWCHLRSRHALAGSAGDVLNSEFSERQPANLGQPAVG